MVNIDYSLGLSQTHDINKLREICKAIGQPFESPDLGVLRRRIRNVCKNDPTLIPLVCQIGGWNPKLDATPSKDIGKKSDKNKENVIPSENPGARALEHPSNPVDLNLTPAQKEQISNLDRLVAEANQIADDFEAWTSTQTVPPPVTRYDVAPVEIVSLPPQTQPPVTLVHSTPKMTTSVADTSFNWNQFADFGGSRIPRTPVISKQNLTPPQLNPLAQLATASSTPACSNIVTAPAPTSVFSNPANAWQIYNDPSYAGLPPPITVPQMVSAATTTAPTNFSVASSVVKPTISPTPLRTSILFRTTAPSNINPSTIVSTPQVTQSQLPTTATTQPISRTPSSFNSTVSTSPLLPATSSIGISTPLASQVSNPSVNISQPPGLPPITDSTDKLTAILTALALGQQAAAQQTQLLTGLLNNSLQMRDNPTPGHPVSPLMHLLKYAQERDICFESREHGKPLSSFIKEIEDLLKLYTQVSKEDFMKIFPKLLKGKAKASFKSNPKAYATWDEAKKELKDAFSSGQSALHEAGQFVLEVQRLDESTEEYIARKVTGNRRLENPLPMSELFSSVVEGLDTKVKKKVDKRNVTTFPALVELARKLDKEKKTETARQALLPSHLRSVTPPSTPSKTPQSTPPRTPPRPSPGNSPRPQSPGENPRRPFSPGGNNSRNVSGNSSPSRNSPAKPESPNSNRTLRFSDEVKTYEPNLSMLSVPGLTCDQTTQCEPENDECHCAPVAPYPTEPTGVPPLGSQMIPHAKYGFQCWNCYSTEHRFRQCPSPRSTIFCYKCGRKGYKLSDCPQHGVQPEVAPISLPPQPQLYSWNAQLQSYVPYQPPVAPPTPVYQPPAPPIFQPQPQVYYTQSQAPQYVPQTPKAQPQTFMPPPQVNVDANYYQPPVQSTPPVVNRRLPYTSPIWQTSDAEISRIPSVNDPYPETEVFCSIPVRPPTPPVSHSNSNNRTYAQTVLTPQIAPVQPATPNPRQKVTVAKRPETPRANPAPQNPQPIAHQNSNPVPHVPSILRNPKTNSSVPERDYVQRPADVAVTYMSPIHDALRFTIDVNIGGKIYQALVDTGSTDTVIHPDVAQDLKKQGHHFEPTQIQARLADGKATPIDEVGVIPVLVGSKNWTGSVMVLPRLPFDVVIGMTVLNHFKSVINLGTKTVTLYDRFGPLDIGFQWMGKPAQVAKEYSTGPIPISVALMFLRPCSNAHFQDLQ